MQARLTSASVTASLVAALYERRCRTVHVEAQVKYEDGRTGSGFRRPCKHPRTRRRLRRCRVRRDDTALLPLPLGAGRGSKTMSARAIGEVILEVEGDISFRFGGVTGA